MRQFFVNCVVNIWREGATEVTSRVRRARRAKPFLAGLRVAIQEPSRREKDTVLGRLPDVEWRVLVPRCWTIRPDDLIEVVKIVRDKARSAALNGAWLRVRETNNTGLGTVAFAATDPQESENAG